MAGPPSPELPAMPEPTMVETVPFGETCRTRWFPASANTTLPALSTTVPTGEFSSAVLPGPSLTGLVVPAIVSMIHVPDWAPTDEIRIVAREMIRITEEYRGMGDKITRNRAGVYKCF